MMREVNDRIYEALAGYGSEDGEFLCECDSSECRLAVKLTLREYAALRESDGLLRVPEHPAAREPA